MILNVVLFLSCGILVSSNNGYPIIPAQTYPIYQQNGYTNPSANQPNDITPYLQSLMVQNQSPTLDLSPSNIGQILLNRLLSSQSMQTNFNQNSRGYGSNLVEFPNNAIVPNAVNNYFATPAVRNSQTRANKEGKTVDINTEEKRKKTKKRKSKSSGQHYGSHKNHKKSHKTNINGVETTNQSKKRSHKPKTEANSRSSRTGNIENNDGKKSKKKRRNENERKKNLVDEENPKPRRRLNKKPKSHKDKTEIIKTTNKPKQIQEGIDVNHFNEGIVEENRVPRKTQEGGELFKSIPNLPQNIAYSFKGLPQFNNPAMSNFFTNYENIYQSMTAKNKGTNKHVVIKRKRPQKSTNRNKPKIRKIRKNATAATTGNQKKSKSTVTPKINIITTEKTILINETPRANINPIPKAENSKPVEKLPEAKEIINEFVNEETKDIESNINDPVTSYEGYIDDYYPQFTDSAAYTANNREVIIKNLEDNKYYYAVDNSNPEFVKKMRFESFGLPERIIKDYEVNKKYDDTEKETMNTDFKSNIQEEVIQFRSPPHLEFPDFQTRKVEWSEINSGHYSCDENDNIDPRYLEDKASFYSETKTPHYTEAKDNNKKIQKDKPKDVETVFVKSKVVSYGPVYNSVDEDSVSAGTSQQVLTDDSYFKDGGTTYVLATSLDYPSMTW